MRKLVTALAGLIATGLAAPSTLAQVADLKIRVLGAESADGTVEISLFSSPEDFMRQPYLQMTGAPAGDGALEANFAAVPTGRYAVVAVHDENENGKLDNGLLGFGGEGYGFSNGVRPLLGWPAFDAAAVTVESDMTIEIELD
jgi:uncharacterized protein (DUF2141 family)